MNLGRIHVEHVLVRPTHVVTVLVEDPLAVASFLTPLALGLVVVDRSFDVGLGREALLPPPHAAIGERHGVRPVIAVLDQVERRGLERASLERLGERDGSLSLGLLEGNAHVVYQAPLLMPSRAATVMAACYKPNSRLTGQKALNIRAGLCCCGGVVLCCCL